MVRLPNSDFAPVESDSHYDPVSMSRITPTNSDADVDPDDMSFDSAVNDLDFDTIDMGNSGGLCASLRCSKATVKRCVVLTVFIAAVVAASVEITKAVGGESGGSAAPSGVGGAGYNVLADPPEDLVTKCDADAIGEPGGYRACEALCVQGECCFLPDRNWFSCVSAYPSQCARYETACDVLDEHSKTGGNAGGAPGNLGHPSSPTASEHTGERLSIPPPPADIDEWCSPSSLSNMDGFDGCSSACDAAVCCMEPVEVCEVTNPEVCADYEACSVLIGNTNTHPESVATQVKAKCNTKALSTVQGVTDCVDICEPALCCSVAEGTTQSLSFTGDSEADTVVGCGSENNADWCDQYQACQTLFHVQDANGGFNSDAEATKAIADACDNVEVPTNLDRCQSLCSPAECCFIGNDACDGISHLDIDCSHYEACYPFFDNVVGDAAEEVLVPRPPPDLEGVCAGPSIKNPEGHQRCADACSAAKCCVTAIETCRVINPQMCDAYEIHCSGAVWNAPFREVTIPDPIPDLETRCEGVSTSNENWSECDESCRPARCCDEDIEVCKVVNPSLCEAYEIHCAVVWGDEFHEVEVPAAPEDIEGRCAGVSANADQWEKCDEACWPALCCDEDIEACMVTNPQACEPYMVHCLEVWDDQFQEVQVPMAPSNLDQVCATNAESEKCSDLCYMAKCCAESIEACKVLNPAACDGYKEPCASYWGDS